nr:hypothetical protein [uncultured Actinoplanes sp.]
MTRLRGTLMAAAVALVLCGACARPAADGAPAAPPRSPAPPVTNANDLVLRTQTYGGFVPPDLTVGRLPEVSVYSDGRVITNGPVPAIYPGRALPNVQVQTVTEAKVKQLLQQAQAAGVRDGADFGRPNVADAPTTQVTIVTTQGRQSVAVEALQQSRPDDPQLTAAQRDARTKLAAFVKTLTDLPTSTGYNPQPYAPEAVAVLARPWQKSGDGPQSPPKAWPGPALPGTYLNPSFKIGCVVVTGTDKDKVLAAAQDATMITPWTAGKDKYLISFRPLLPDEKDCAVLQGPRR